jgi:putative transposase
LSNARINYHAYKTWFEFDLKGRQGDIGKFVYQSIYAHIERSWCEVIELNVQPDHVHLLVKVPPKISISDLIGKVKGKTAIHAFQKFPNCRLKL